MLLGCQIDGFTDVRSEKQSHLAKERWQVNAGLIRASKFLWVTLVGLPKYKGQTRPRSSVKNLCGLLFKAFATSC
jgi:hypothetical protein